ncbi:MAG: hypothetical protein ACRYF3_04760 [Janthinobacterium lividum]
MARDVRDGLVQRLVGGVVIGADAEVDAGVRAAALALLVPPGSVILGEAAAWVHAGARLPVADTIWIATTRRAVRGDLDGVVIRTTRALPPPEDVVVVAGQLVTTPARTLVDVARTTPGRAARVRRALSGMGLRGEDVADAAGRITGLAHVRTARALLAVPRPSPALRSSPPPKPPSAPMPSPALRPSAVATP